MVVSRSSADMSESVLLLLKPFTRDLIGDVIKSKTDEVDEADGGEDGLISSRSRRSFARLFRALPI